MFSKDLFANRFKCLRLAHYLSSAQCAYFLGFKSTGSIANMESGKFTPLVEKLVVTGYLFGVSNDWLLGITNTPYVKENMEFTEDYVWHVITLDIQEIPRFFEEFDDFDFPPDYVRKDRRDVYPLVIRANILFLLAVLFTSEVHPGKKKEEESYRKTIQKRFSCSIEELLKGLLSQEIQEPVFDLTHQPVEYRQLERIW